MPAVLATTRKMAKDTLATLLDGTGTPVTLALSCLQSFTDPDVFPEDVVFMCRGVVDGSREGDAVVYEITLETIFLEHTNVAVGAIRDFMLGINAYSANISTNTKHEKHAFDLKLETTAGSEQAANAVRTHSDCVLKAAQRTPGKPDSVTWTLTCYGGSAVTGEI